MQPTLFRKLLALFWWMVAVGASFTGLLAVVHSNTQIYSLLTIPVLGLLAWYAYRASWRHWQSALLTDTDEPV